jgi:hypothetical protein
MIPQNKTVDHRIDFDSWSRNNPHICTIPYQEVHYDLNYADTGSSFVMGPCCWYKNSGVGNHVIQIKKNIESGLVDKNCDICHRQESSQQFSGRQRALKNFSPDQLNEFLENKTIKFFDMFFMFSNKCNMACRSCGKWNSSLYDSIWNNKKNIPMSIGDDPNFWKTIKADIQEKASLHEDLRMIIMGGEGTIQEDLYHLTDWLQQENLNKKITLQIGSNGSVFLEDKFMSWCDSFKNVSFALSVDSTNEDNFLYVRYPVKFEKINENLQKFKSLAELKSNFSFYITPTFHANNIAYLKDFLDYFENFQVSEKCVAIYDNTLYQPAELALLSLPSMVKEKLFTQIQSLINHDYKVWDTNPTFKKSIESMLDQLKTTDFSEKVWKKYISTTARWDQLTDNIPWINNKNLWDLLSVEDQESYRQERAKLS